MSHSRAKADSSCQSAVWTPWRLLQPCMRCAGNKAFIRIIHKALIIDSSCHLTAGMVEAWVQKLVDGMQNTMKAVIKRAACNVNETSLEDLLFSNPAQVALLGLQFQWTADTQVCDPFPTLPVVLLLAIQKDRASAHVLVSPKQAMLYHYSGMSLCISCSQ